MQRLRHALAVATILAALVSVGMTLPAAAYAGNKHDRLADGQAVAQITVTPVDRDGQPIGPPQTQTQVLPSPGQVVPMSNSGDIGNGGYASGCHQATVWVRQYTTLGALHWQWNQDVYWCHDGTNITATPSVGNYITNADSTVNYLGVFGTNDYWYSYFSGHLSSGYVAKHQGHIQYCTLGSTGCYDNKYPEIQTFAHGDGTMHWWTNAG